MSTGGAWQCPACDRQVPGRVTACRCGYERNGGAADESASEAGRQESGALGTAALVITALAALVAAAWAMNGRPAASKPAAALARSAAAGPAAAPGTPASVSPGAAAAAPDRRDLPEPAAMPLEQLVEAAMPAIVKIETAKARGSGFFVRPDLVATNAHVVADFTDVRVTTRGETTLEGRVVLASTDYDIAFVRVPRVGPPDPRLDLGDSSRLRLGEGVVALGWAQSLSQSSITRGVITGLRRDGDRRLLQTDAVPHPGDSGGPLLNRSGQVVGVMALMKKDGSAGFAVAVEDLERLAPQAEGSLSLPPVAAAAAPAPPVTVTPAPAPVADNDARRAHGLDRYQQTMLAIAQRAGQLDTLWTRYKARCGITSVPAGGTHEWFQLYDPRSPLHRAPTWCAATLDDLERRADGIGADVAAADEDARRSDVYPGERREVRQSLGLDYAAWDR